LSVGGLHMATATALVACTALRIERAGVVAFGTAQLLERVYPTKKPREASNFQNGKGDVDH
jgi:hypothetical protein